MKIKINDNYKSVKLYKKSQTTSLCYGGSGSFAGVFCYYSTLINRLLSYGTLNIAFSIIVFISVIAL
jgi:hypothetical protein